MTLGNMRELGAEQFKSSIASSDFAEAQIPAASLRINA
jgi:hypothetical protein